MLLSIITVNYNDAKGLEKTIQSVRSQTYQDFEHIIIDGDSDDGSKAVIEKHTDSFSYWVSEPDTGIYNAMNKGIKIAKGEYLLFLNSGDWLYDNEILKNVSSEINGNIDIYYGDLVFIKKNGQKVEKYPKKLTFKYFYNKSIGHPATFIKRSLFNEIFYYNEKLKIVSDWEFFICAICKYNVSYRHLDLVVSNFDTNGMSSLPENNSIIKTEHQKVLEEHFPLFLDDYKELKQSRNILQSNRFKMLLELEKSIISKKISLLYLRISLFVFRGKNLKNLK